MSFMKQFLIISALVGALFTQNKAYSQPVVIPGGKEFVYAGITAIFGYMAYSWYQQVSAQPAITVEPAVQVRTSITAAVLLESIDITFNPFADDFYENYLDRHLKDQGYSIYLEGDQQEMINLLDNLRLYVDQIPQQEVPNALYNEIDELEQEVRNELRLTEEFIDKNLVRETAARAARGAYYFNRCNSIVEKAASQQ